MVEMQALGVHFFRLSSFGVGEGEGTYFGGWCSLSLGFKSPCQRMISWGVNNHLNEANRPFRFHETILSFGEPGSLGYVI